MIQHFCAMPTCRKLIPVRQLYCDEHAPQARKNEYKVRRDGDRELYDFYHSKRWTMLAKRFKTAHPLCAECLKSGVIRKADICDHVKPVKDYWELRWDVDNLNSTCLAHHNNKTAIETTNRRNKVNN